MGALSTCPPHLAQLYSVSWADCPCRAIITKQTNPGENQVFFGRYCRLGHFDLSEMRLDILGTRCNRKIFFDTGVPRRNVALVVREWCEWLRKTFSHSSTGDFEDDPLSQCYLNSICVQITIMICVKNIPDFEVCTYHLTQYAYEAQ